MVRMTLSPCKAAGVAALALIRCVNSRLEVTLLPSATVMVYLKVPAAVEFR